MNSCEMESHLIMESHVEREFRLSIRHNVLKLKIIFITMTVTVIVMMYVTVTFSTTKQLQQENTNFLYTKEHPPEHTELMRCLTQRNELSKQLNLVKQAYGQLNCEKLIIRQEKGEKVDPRVSEHGGWCAKISRPGSPHHIWDEGFSLALSTMLEGKKVASFGEGPGLYKKHIDSLRQVVVYDAYDGAPYSENVTKGEVKFLDLTSPQFGLPAYDWVVSVEVGEHIPAKYENVYLDNLVRHAREGIILSWATRGQDGLSHVNTKRTEDVFDQMKLLGFLVDKKAEKPLRQSCTLKWLKRNVHVYYRIDLKSFIEEDV